MDLPQFIRQEAKRAEGFAELVKNIDRLAALEQLSAETTRAVEKSLSERNAAQAALANLQKAEAESRKAGIAILDAAKVQADEIISSAKRNADALLAEAKDAAAKAKARENAAEAAERKAIDAVKSLTQRFESITGEMEKAEATIARAAQVSALLAGR